MTRELRAKLAVPQGFARRSRVCPSPLLVGCLIADSLFCSTRLREKEKEINKLKEQYEAEINNLRGLVRQKQRQLELMIGENRCVMSTGPHDA